jgi:hypothetical protein
MPFTTTLSGNFGTIGKSAGTIPSWVTNAGQLLTGTTLYTTRSFSTSVQADGAASYYISEGALPTGVSLNAANGTISGTPTGIADYNAGTTYNFTVGAIGTGGGSFRAFSLVVRSINVGYSCLTMNENEGGGVSAPGGFIFTRVDFSSYGTPNGGCGGFSLGGCHAGVGVGMPTTSVYINANNDNYGDPCNGTRKRYYGQFTYQPV